MQSFKLLLQRYPQLRTWPPNLSRRLNGFPKGHIPQATRERRQDSRSGLGCAWNQHQRVSYVRGALANGRHNGSGAKRRRLGLRPRSLGTGPAIGSPDQRGRSRMRRRDFIAGLGSTVAWPVMAHAQQRDRVRKVGVLIGGDENDPEAKARFSEFLKELTELGWTDGRNLQIDIRWARANADRARMYAKELVALQPDVLLAQATAPTAALQQETKTIPIVFVGVSDPVGAAWFAGLPRPAENITGLLNLDVSMGGKWLQLLLEIAPGIKRAAAMFHPDAGTASYYTAADAGTAPYYTAAMFHHDPGPASYYIPSFEAAARSLDVEPITVPVQSDAEIEAAITSLGREPRGGLVVMPDSGFMLARRAQIIRLAARNKVPAVYNDSIYVKDGGLLSYGTNRADITRRSASLVDRILKVEKPTNVPVQAPVNFQMALNARTANALGLTVPQSILLLADEVIQ